MILDLGIGKHDAQPSYLGTGTAWTWVGGEPQAVPAISSLSGLVGVKVHMDGMVGLRVCMEGKVGLKG